ADLANTIAERDYKAFLAKCAQHGPWIWKDPRLWVTIRFWRKFSDFENCKFIVLTRGLVQCWVSATLRRQIRTYRHLSTYEESIKQSSLRFLKDNRFSWISLRYEDLIQRPAPTLEKLNDHLGTRLTIDDLQSVYTKRLYKAPRSPLSDYA